jgi:hypothetical protein
LTYCETTTKFLNGFLSLVHENNSIPGTDQNDESKNFSCKKYIQNLKKIQKCISIIPTKRDIEEFIEMINTEEGCEWLEDTSVTHFCLVLKYCLDMYEAFHQHSFRNKLIRSKSGGKANSKLRLQSNVKEILKLQCKLIKKINKLDSEQINDLIHSTIDRQIYSKLGLQPICRYFISFVGHKEAIKMHFKKYNLAKQLNKQYKKSDFYE